MRSKTSFFNPTVFRKNLTRYWPIWAVYLVVWLLLLPLSLRNELRWSGEWLTVLSLRDTTLQLTSTAGPIMSAVFGLMAAMAVYSYLYNARAASWMHALPLRRETLFCSSYLSGLSFLLLPNVLVFLVALLVEATHGMADPLGLLTWLGAVSLSGVFFFSFASLCAQLTGHILILPLVYAILNVVVVGAELLVRCLAKLLLYGAAFSEYSLTLVWGSPLVQLLMRGDLVELYAEGTGSWTGVLFTQWPALLGYLAVGVVMTAGALLLYRRRRTESAGDVVAVRPLKPVFRYCMAFGMAISLGLLLCTLFNVSDSYGMDRLLRMLPCLLISAGIGYFAAEMLMKKTLRVFRRGLPGFLLCCVVLAAALVLVECDVGGYERRIPDKAEVESVSVWLSGSGYYAPDSAETVALAEELHRSLIEHKTELEQEQADFRDTKFGAQTAPEQRVAYNEYQVEFTYRLTDGSSLSRSYWLPVTQALLDDPDSPAARAEALVNAPSVIANRYRFSPADAVVIGGTVSPGNYVSGDAYRQALDQVQAQRLYDAILEDVAAGRLGQLDLLTGSPTYGEDSATLDCGIELEARYEYFDTQGERHSYITTLNLSLGADSTASRAVLEELVGPVRTIGEVLREMGAYDVPAEGSTVAVG